MVEELALVSFLFVLAQIDQVSHLDGNFDTRPSPVAVGANLDCGLVTVTRATSHAALRALHILDLYKVLLLVNAFFLL